MKLASDIMSCVICHIVHNENVAFFIAQFAWSKLDRRVCAVWFDSNAVEMTRSRKLNHEHSHRP